MDVHGSTVTFSHLGLILSPEHPWVNRHVIPSRPHPFCRTSMGQNKITSIQTSPFPNPKSVPRTICRSSMSIHGPTMISSTQTWSFPQSIHSPTWISATQTSSAQKANGTYYIWDSEHRRMAADVPPPSSSHSRPTQISLDNSLSSCRGTNCRLRKISSRLWLTFHDSSCCSDFQIVKRNIIACA